MGSKGIKQLGGNNSLGEMIGAIIGVCIVIAVIIGFIYGMYLMFNAMVEMTKPIAQYEKTITVADKKVKEYYTTRYTVKNYNGSQVMVPEKKLEIRYYIEGTDRLIYSIPKEYFDRVKFNDTIKVIILEYNNDNGLYIYKILSF